MVPDILSAITQTQQQEQTSLQQMASGKRVNTPSDDPAAAAAEVETLTRSNAVDQYTANSSTVLDMVQTADSALSSVSTQLTQAVSLATQAASSGTLTDAQKQTITQQVQDIIQSVAAQANTTYHGLYLFAGTKTTTAPFAASTSDPTGFAYSGSSGSGAINTVEIGPGMNVQVNIPGDQVFQNAGGNVMGSLQQLATALQGGSSTDIANASSAVNNAVNYVSQKRAIYGNAEAQIQSQQTDLQQESTDLQSQENDLVGADMSKTIILFTQAQVANQAAMAAAARILPESLLDYLK
jgi:flagellar hook-associated protein 3 FlgL